MGALNELRAEGWRVEELQQQGRPYYRAHRGDFTRGNHRPEGLLEMCRRAPVGRLVQLSLWSDAETRKAA